MSQQFASSTSFAPTDELALAEELASLFSETAKKKERSSNEDSSWGSYGASLAILRTLLILIGGDSVQKSKDVILQLFKSNLELIVGKKDENGNMIKVGSAERKKQAEFKLATGMMIAGGLAIAGGVISLGSAASLASKAHTAHTKMSQVSANPGPGSAIVPRAQNSVGLQRSGVSVEMTRSNPSAAMPTPPQATTASQSQAAAPSSASATSKAPIPNSKPIDVAKKPVQPRPKDEFTTMRQSPDAKPREVMNDAQKDRAFEEIKAAWRAGEKLPEMAQHALGGQGIPGQSGSIAKAQYDMKKAELQHEAEVQDAIARVVEGEKSIATQYNGSLMGTFNAISIAKEVLESAIIAAQTIR